MSAKELTLRVLMALRPMLPGLIAVAAVTLLVLPFLLVACKKAWVNDPRFRVAGLFYGLSGRDACFLACSWIKLILMLVLIIGFQKLAPVQYLMVLLPGILGIICARSGGSKLKTMLWLVLQMAGLLSVNLMYQIVISSTTAKCKAIFIDKFKNCLCVIIQSTYNSCVNLKWNIQLCQKSL